MSEVKQAEETVMRRHVVTKASDDGTFDKGDHIIFNEDGSISCIEGRGWLEAEYVAEATKGMESVPDSLKEELASLGA